MRCQQRITVDAHQVLATRCNGAHAQGHSLALVLRQVQHPQTRILHGQGVEDGAGVVFRTIVDRDDLDVRVLLAQRRMNGFSDVVAFVEARDEDRNQRLAGQRWRQGVFVPRPVPLPVQPEIESPGDPQSRHEQWIEEHEVHQELASE
ncbi:hypothetical protein D3C85_1071140 [compost metagenome]